MSKKNLVATILVVAFICNTAASAQENRGTPEQQAACTPDAFRLCSGYIPDPNKVESCLRQRKRDLSRSCRLVFDASETAASIAGK